MEYEKLNYIITYTEIREMDEYLKCINSLYVCVYTIQYEIYEYMNMNTQVTIKYVLTYIT